MISVNVWYCEYTCSICHKKKKNEKNEGKVQYCSFSFLHPRVIVLIDWEMSICVVFDN